LPRQQLPVKPPPELQRLDQPTTPEKLQTAQSLADAGRLAEAEELCRACLRERGPSAQAYYLLGLVCDAAGETGQAVTSYRKALYLEPNHGDALLQLALLAEKDGDRATARLFRQRARRASLNSLPQVGRAAPRAVPAAERPILAARREIRLTNNPN
jgi:chemotaxis protein methyltransferase WspC